MKSEKFAFSCIYLFCYLMVGLGILQLTSWMLTFPLQRPCQGWVAAPDLPWEWKGPLSDSDCLSPILHP